MQRVWPLCFPGSDLILVRYTDVAPRINIGNSRVVGWLKYWGCGGFARILKKTYLVQRKLPVKAGRYVRVNCVTYCHIHTNNQQFAIASYPKCWYISALNCYLMSVLIYHNQQENWSQVVLEMAFNVAQVVSYVSSTVSSPPGKAIYWNGVSTSVVKFTANFHSSEQEPDIKWCI